MKNTIIWIIVAVVIGAGIYWYMNRTATDDTGTQDEVVVALSSQNNSGMSGTATLVPANGGTRASLDLTGAPEGVNQPAHIHAGACPDVGAVVYPLEFPLNGVSETMLDVSLDEILGQLPLAVNVHKSPEEADVYVACGDITQ